MYSYLDYIYTYFRDAHAEVMRLPIKFMHLTAFDAFCQFINFHIPHISTQAVVVVIITVWNLNCFQLKFVLLFLLFPMHKKACDPAGHYFAS